MPSPPPTLSLAEGVAVCRRRWRVLAVSVLGTMLLAAWWPGLLGRNFEASVGILMGLPTEDAETTAYHLSDTALLQQVIRDLNLRTTPTRLAGRMRVAHISRGVSGGVRIAVLAGTAEEARRIVDALANHLLTIHVETVAQTLQSLQAARDRYLARAPAIKAELEELRYESQLISKQVWDTTAGLPDLLQELQGISAMLRELRSDVAGTHERTLADRHDVDTVTVTLERINKKLGLSSEEFEEYIPLLRKQNDRMNAMLELLSRDVYGDDRLWVNLLTVSGVPKSHLTGLLGTEQALVNIDIIEQSLQPRVIYTEVRPLAPWPVMLRNAAAGMVLALILSFPLLTLLEYQRLRTQRPHTPPSEPAP